MINVSKTIAFTGRKTEKKTNLKKKNLSFTKNTERYL